MTENNLVNLFDNANEFREKIGKNLKSGGSGGTYDGMEQRVGRIEIKMDKVEERLTSIEVLMATMNAKLDSKIDYKWLTVYVLGIVAVIMRSEIAGLFAVGSTP